MAIVTDTRLEAFTARVDDVVHRHPVVVDNRYTRWFAGGEASRDELRHLTVQFSVFSHLFVEAQLRKVINAANLESYRAGKEILMNELGVVFNGRTDDEGVASTGSVDGGRFTFKAAHFEWLLRFATPLGLTFEDLGKRRHGTTSTLFFCDELLRIYGSDDASEAEGASYAVEHWAAAGFWKELIAGLKAFKARECPDLNLAFWTWHDKVEDQHAEHTADELAEAFHMPGFDHDKFLTGAAEMLDGVKSFWDGLEADRLAGEGVVMALDVEHTVAPPRLGGIDHLEWWVGNARSFAGFLASAYGFDIVAHAGAETGRRDRNSYLLQQGDIRFLVTGALGPDSDVADHVRRHGDGIRDIAFLVDDVDAAYDSSLARGACGLRAPADDEDDNGIIRHAAIATYGETVHTFMDRSRYSGPFAPQFEPAELPRPIGPSVGLARVDHVVGNVELGTLDRWVHFYERVLGFNQLVHFSDDAISTEYSALMSTVVWNGDKVVLPINEPAEGRRRSQIEEYLDYYGSPGVQHIAMRTDDIVTAVRALRERGVRFLNVPASYYDDAKKRLDGIDVPWGDVADLGILVDRDHEGHLLQIFTETVTDRPTVFFEIIQREGARGFGEGNFKALFQAIEREQDRRGNL